MKIFKFFIMSLLLLFTIYSMAWSYMAQEFKKEIDIFYETDGPKQGYKFHGESPTLSGFPLKPIITYNKGFSKDGVNIQFEKLTITTMPFPEKPLDIKIDTLAIQTSPTGQLYEIDSLKTVLVPPKSLPAKMTRPHLAQWQKEIGKINVESLEIRKNTALFKARGFIGLDQNLQPILNFDTKMTDYEKLIRFMRHETSELKPLTANIIFTVLNSLSETDKETGEKSVELNMQIKKRRLIMGIIKTISIPEVKWPENA